MFHLTDNEKIVMKVRKHWFVFFAEGVVVAVMMLFPFLLYLFLPIHGPYFPLFMFFASLWLLICWLSLFIMWTHNYLDIFIITNRRIIDIEQRTLFSRHIASLHLEQLEDVSVEVNGFMATIFGYGDITVQTAGEAREIFISSIPDPERVREVISEQYEKSVREISIAQRT